MKHKIGDKLQVHCYKHNGRINSISDEAIVLDETDDMLVCANYKAKLFDDDGKCHRTKEPAIIFFYKDKWYNIIAQFKKSGLTYYCNIASPYLIDENVIKYIDYDLDLRVFPDGAFKVLDRNEYNYHKKIMNYSDDLKFIIAKELENLIKLKENGNGPFDKQILTSYLEKYEMLKKPTK